MYRLRAAAGSPALPGLSPARPLPLILAKHQHHLRFVAEGETMDLHALREMAIEAASRALYEKHGFVPSEESDEWEDEYRRQFAALKQRYGSQVTVPSRPAAAATPQRQLPELSGTPEQLRWGASIRGERLREIPSEAVRTFWVETWPRAKQWIDTRDVPTQTLLQREAAIRRVAQEADRGRGGAQGRSTEKGGRGGRLSAQTERGRHHAAGPRRTDRRQRALRPGAACRQARRYHRRSPAFARLRDHRSQPASGQGEGSARQSRIRDRARRGARRRPQALRTAPLVALIGYIICTCKCGAAPSCGAGEPAGE